jgi:hypothetical protein
MDVRPSTSVPKWGGNRDSGHDRRLRLKSWFLRGLGSVSGSPKVSEFESSSSLGCPRPKEEQAVSPFVAMLM